MFGADGSQFFEDLMRTDPVIVEGIAKSGSLEALLGSVYSPIRLTSPRQSYGTSPWTPDGKGGHTAFRFPVSPTMEPGLVRRSARLTPTSAWAAEHHDGRGSKRRRGAGGGSPFRKTLRMDNDKGSRLLGSPNDFEAFVMGSGPSLPMTPFLGESPGEAGRHVKQKIFSSEKRKPTVSKRGEYKCGKCGFYPKKQKHDCAQHKLLQQQQQQQRQQSRQDSHSASTPAPPVLDPVGFL